MIYQSRNRKYKIDIAPQDEVVPLTSLIAPAFYKVHQDIKQELHTHYVLGGGRGSTKSSFVSVELVKGIMEDPEANAIVYRKVGDTLRESVYPQLIWAIESLKVSDEWSYSVSPLRLTYRPTGQMIVFKGLDDASKSKSIKVAHGYLKYLWFEEFDQFDGMEEIRKVQQSVMRGGPKFIVFKTYNPPKSMNNWVNQEVLVEREDTLYHHSDYLSVPVEWLGQTFIDEAEELKRTKPKAYEHEYLGKAVGTGGQVFENVVVRRITDDELSVFDKIRQGLDFGYGGDPLAYEKMHFNKTQRKLYIFGEIYQVKLGNRQFAEKVRAFNPHNHVIVADSEDPRSIADLRDRGLNIIGAKKGPGSVEHGILYLSEEIDEIIIDPYRCPNTAREFTSYELEKDKFGNFKGSYPDKNNHSIDAVRYGLEDAMSFNRARIKKKTRYGFV